MVRNHDASEGNKDGSGVNRRSYLKLLGTIGAVGVSQQAIGSASAATDVTRYVDGGYGTDGFGGVAESALAVSTGQASDVSSTEATLTGEITDHGGASSVEASFTYRRTGADVWRSTGSQSLAATGAFSTDVASLDSGTEYEFRAVAATGDGNATDTAQTFTTPTADGSDTSGLPNEIRVDGSATSEWTRYEITVSDSITKDAGANDHDTVDGDTVQGWVRGGVDTYSFAGEVTDVQVGGDVTVSVNDSRLDLSQFSANELRVDGSATSEWTRYEITVSDSITKGVGANDHDTVDGDTVQGWVSGGVDTYSFAGEVTDVQVGGDIAVYANGTRLDAGSL